MSDESSSLPLQEIQEEFLLEEEDLGSAKKRPKMPPSRIAFLVFVTVAVVAILVEAQARWGYSQTVKQLQQTWQKLEGTQEGLYRKDLDEFIHGRPSRELDQEKQMETFTWRGIRTHCLQVRYISGDFVVGFETLSGEATELK